MEEISYSPESNKNFLRSRKKKALTVKEPKISQAAESLKRTNSQIIEVGETFNYFNPKRVLISKNKKVTSSISSADFWPNHMKVKLRKTIQRNCKGMISEGRVLEKKQKRQRTLDEKFKRSNRTSGSKQSFTDSGLNYLSAIDKIIDDCKTARAIHRNFTHLKLSPSSFMKFRISLD